MKIISFFIFVILILLSSAVVLAEDGKDFNFDEDLSYNICYMLDERNVALIEEATINSVKDVGDTSFLVFTRKGFVFKPLDGLIRMDAIIAILPTDQARSLGNTFCRISRKH